MKKLIFAIVLISALAQSGFGTSAIKIANKNPAISYGWDGGGVDADSLRWSFALLLLTVLAAIVLTGLLIDWLIRQIEKQTK
jgi:hypothetical protein